MTIADCCTKKSYAIKCDEYLLEYEAIDIMVRSLKANIDTYQLDALYSDGSILEASDKASLDAKLAKLVLLVADL